MGKIAIVVGLALAGCVRAHTPDGKTWSCLRHTKPNPDHGGAVSTLYDANGAQFSCVGPHGSEMPLPQSATMQSAQKDFLALRPSGVKPAIDAR